jgi:hypothetical protein
MELNLMVATPAYGCMVHIDYLDSMIALVRGGMEHGVGVEIVTIGNNSLVPKARDALISYFHENTAYTHLIFVDADIKLSKDAIPTLLKRNVDVIGCPVPLKGYDEQGLPVLNIGKVFSFDETGLADVEHVGNAVLMLSRKAVTDIVGVSEKYEHDPRFSRGEKLVQTNYEVFKIGVVNGNYLPEDYYLCYRLRQLGYKIYADYSIIPKHNGMYGFEVNKNQLNGIFNKYLNKPTIPKVVSLLDKLNKGRK